MKVEMNEEDSDDNDETTEPNSLEITHQNIYKQLQTPRQIQFHKTIASTQRESYDKIIGDTSSFYNYCITIEMDFKQKITYDKMFLCILKTYLNLSSKLII
jgi:hypothetical protein